MSRFRVWVRLAGLSLALPSIALTARAAAQTPQSLVRCESDGSYKRCPAAQSWRGARLVQQISQAPCLQGKNWGFEQNTVWVNDGCRGVFDAGDPYADVGQTVTCASASGGRAECPADIRYGVTLVRQLSTTSCTQGRTWGTSNGGIWVDQGCRGEFEIGGGAAGGTSTTGRVSCGVATGQQVTCKTNGYAASVRLVNDLAAGKCRQGQSWGYTYSFIWASQGCRGEFEVTYRGVAGGGTGAGGVTQRVTCGASTLQRVTCASNNTIASARLVRDLSANRCRQNTSWGYTAAALWIKDGCIGDFEVTVGQPGGAQARTRLISCGSGGIQQTQCPTEGDAAGVRLVSEVTSGSCRERVNWGYTNTVIWTDRGCRGQFEVTYRAGRSPLSSPQR